MRLKWYGQACFLITSETGSPRLRIVTDPYTPETSGYRPVSEAADIVIMSSDNDSFHCRADLIPGQPTVINALEVAQHGGERTAHGITFRAIEAMEMLAHPEHAPDQNGMYRFTVDGISVGHMGDVGNPLSEAQIAFFEGVDVLLALTGGTPTIGLDDLKTVIDRAKPRWVVPMHFRTLRYKPRKIFWIQSFLDYFSESDVDIAADSEISLTRESLPSSTRVLVLDNA
ncbi:MAG: MBL fold metallo-hydrolase [Aggregatilineales bacterium]